MLNLMEIMKELSTVLTTPVTITGRPLSAEELRHKRKQRARKRMLGKSGSLEFVNEPSQFILRGLIEEGDKSPFSVDGQDFIIEDATWVVGIVVPGALATIKGVIERDGQHHAKSIVVATHS